MFYEHLENINHPVFQVLKQEPSFLYEERNEMLLGILSSSFTEASLVNIEFAKEQFSLLNDYLSIGEAFDIKLKKNRKINVNSAAVGKITRGLKSIFENLKYERYSHYMIQNFSMDKNYTINNNSVLFEKLADLSFILPNFEEIICIYRSKLIDKLKETLYWTLTNQELLDAGFSSSLGEYDISFENTSENFDQNEDFNLNFFTTDIETNEDVETSIPLNRIETFANTFN